MMRDYLIIFRLSTKELAVKKNDGIGGYSIV